MWPITFAAAAGVRKVADAHSAGLAFHRLHALHMRTEKNQGLMHTHMAAHTTQRPLLKHLSLFRLPFVLSRQEDGMFFFLFLFRLPLNKNNLLSDVGCLIVVTEPKLKCGLIKASECVCVCAYAHVCSQVGIRARVHIPLTLIRPINSLSVTKSALAARQTQLPVKSVLLLFGLSAPNDGLMCVKR